MNATEMRAAVVAAAGGSVAKASGVGVSAAYVDGLYSGVANAYNGDFDANARAIFLGDWTRALSKSNPRGTFFPSSRITADGTVVQIYKQGYFSTQAYADQWDHIRAPLVETFQEAPKSLISVAHIEAGLVPLTAEERVAVDEAIAAGQVTSTGHVALDFQLEVGKATSSAPASDLPAPKPDGSLPGVSGPIRPGPSTPSGGPSTIVGTLDPDSGKNLLAEFDRPSAVEDALTVTPGSFADKLRMVPLPVWVILAVVAAVVLSKASSRS